jgi:hypothetical protein
MRRKTSEKVTTLLSLAESMKENHCSRTAYQVPGTLYTKIHRITRLEILSHFDSVRDVVDD